MTSAELKHRVKLQEWAARIQDCRSSGLPVRMWCRQEDINASNYYRWERDLLTATNGTLQNIPLLLSHACPAALGFDGYFETSPASNSSTSCSLEPLHKSLQALEHTLQTMTVTLSRPPPASAVATRAFAQAATSTDVDKSRVISSIGTMSVRPSEQSRNMSSG